MLTINKLFYYPVPGVQIVERSGKWGASTPGKRGRGGGVGGRARERRYLQSPSSLPSFFFLREFYSRAVLSERLEQATTLPGYAIG